MATDTNAQAQIGKPSIWVRLGFRHKWDQELFDWRMAEPGPEDWFVPGTLHVVTNIRFDWLDRLRLLVSGRCEVRTWTRTSVPLDRVESRGTTAVLGP